MTTVRKRQSRATIATLLAIILMAVSTLLSANSPPMAMSHATDNIATTTPALMAHCHHGSEAHHDGLTPVSTSDHHMATMHGCADADTCQCITLCQITAASDTPFQGTAFIPATPGTPALISAIHAGIHRLPLRPPSLSV
ncbi:hypothetical protein [Alcanivorax sp.]|uniref:hypothetical protein n=1 Tax=Alcanivorax sp. TaxID=1872427 RepID=UPI002B26D358|nr:hypothetical protein [Alcanivorax sp.]